MSGLKCSKCNKSIDPLIDLYVYHDDCGHYSHAGTCDDGSQSKCSNCIQLASAPISIEKEEESIGSGERTPTNDSLRKPLPAPRQQGIFDRMMNWANKASASQLNRNETVETSRHIHFLLQNQYPIKSLLQEKEISLADCIEAGVTIDDILANGYRFEDLKEFPEFRSKESAIQAFDCLQTTAEHFRDHWKELPAAEIRKWCGIDTRVFSEHFGIGFYPSIGLSSETCDVPGEWTLEDVMRLGYDSFDLLKKCGLKKLSHWKALSPTREQCQKLRATRKKVMSLTDDTAIIVYSKKVEKTAPNRRIKQREKSSAKAVAPKAPPDDDPKNESSVLVESYLYGGRRRRTGR